MCTKVNTDMPTPLGTGVSLTLSRLLSSEAEKRALCLLFEVASAAEWRGGRVISGESQKFLPQAGKQP